MLEKTMELHDEFALILSGHNKSEITFSDLNASEKELNEVRRLAEIGRLTEKLLETGSMQHRFKYLDDIRSVEQLIELGQQKGW